MTATHISGQDYAYVFNADADTPVFHSSRDCAGKTDSDMTKSAAVGATLDGEMTPCGTCCGDFLIELHDKPITEIPLDRGGWFRVGGKKATVKADVDVDELHRDVYRELAQRGMRME